MFDLLRLLSEVQREQRLLDCLLVPGRPGLGNAVTMKVHRTPIHKLKKNEEKKEYEERSGLK